MYLTQAVGGVGMFYDERLAPDLQRELGHIITHCLAAIRAGIPVDRHALLTQYPALADHLRAFFATWDAETSHNSQAEPTLLGEDQESQSLPNEATIGGPPA